MSYPIIESIGIEFETDSIIRGDRNTGIDNFQQEHDASIESYCYVHKNRLYKHMVKNNSNRVVIGCEYKSKVFTFNCKDDLYNNICDLLEKAEILGDSYQSERSGIHIHVCMPYNLNILKSILRACAHLEQVFFYLGGMGYKNRGVTNEFAFCRPITKYGPALVNYSTNKFAPCFNLKDLFESTTVEEFFKRYGDITVGNPPRKYTPSRYHWITLYPLLTYGTIEFRIFNKTFNPLYLYTVIKFSQQVANLCLTNKFLSLNENSIYDNQAKEYVLETMLQFIKDYNMDLTETDKEILCDIVENTPQINLAPRYCLSHLTGENGQQRYFRDNYIPSVVVNSGTDIITPQVVTIHNLPNLERPLL